MDLKKLLKKSFKSIRGLTSKLNFTKKSRHSQSLQSSQSSLTNGNDCKDLQNENKIMDKSDYDNDNIKKQIDEYRKNKNTVYDYDYFRPKGTFDTQLNLVSTFAYYYYKLKPQMEFIFKLKNKLSLKNYVSNMYEKINFYIRYISKQQIFSKESEKIDDDYIQKHSDDFILYEKIINDIDKLFKCIPKTKLKIITYRAYVSHPPNPILNEIQPLIQYTSTALSYQFAKKWIEGNNPLTKKIIKIIIPPKNKILPLFDYCSLRFVLNQRCDDKTEFEILLNRFGYLKYIKNEIVYNDDIEVYEYITPYIIEGNFRKI